MPLLENIKSHFKKKELKGSSLAACFVSNGLLVRVTNEE